MSTIEVTGALKAYSMHPTGLTNPTSLCSLCVTESLSVSRFTYMYV